MSEPGAIETGFFRLWAKPMYNARVAQFRNSMMIELGTDAAKLVSGAPLLPEKGWTRSGRGGGSYDGMPITADNIFRQIKGEMEKEI